MPESSFNIERATNGLVLALFLASAAFLGVILYFVLRDMDRRAPSEDDRQSARDPVPAQVQQPPALTATRFF